MTDQELIDELSLRFERSRKAFYDLTVVHKKLMEMNQKLEQSERLKSNFLSNIRNEINNPITVLSAVSDRIMALAHQSSELYPMADILHHEAFDLEFKLRNIIMAADLEAGVALPTPAQFSPEALLQEQLTMFRPLAKRQGANLNGTVSVVLDTSSQIVTGDAEKLAVIMANLISNAIKFGGPGHNIHIALDVSDRTIQLQITDNGIGIAKQDIPRLFERFRQLDSGSTRAYLGQGLGLSVVKSLVDLLEGQIEISSELHQGTTVTVCLPCMPLSPEEATIAAVGSNLFLFDAKAA